jgi:5'-nucleotidase
MRSVEAHELPITRAIFMQGKSPYEYISALKMSLFLSAHESDVYKATQLNMPAGLVLESSFVDDPQDHSVRIAFDFDGVLADDSSENVYRSEAGMEGYRSHEVANATVAHDPGPLRDLLAKINRIQQRERERLGADPDYKQRVFVALITARDAPAHERALFSMKHWGVRVNDAFFLGGIEKAAVTAVWKPHIFFDDQVGHLKKTSALTPSVHVPFGLLNRKAGDNCHSSAPSSGPHSV